MLFLIVRVSQLIIGHDALNDGRVDIVDAWSESNKSLGVIKDGVEGSEEGLSKDPFVDVVILEWEEAFVAFADVHHKALWCKLHVVPVVYEKRNAPVAIECARSHQHVVDQFILGLVHNFVEGLGSN